jgi:hypothetical protein
MVKERSPTSAMEEKEERGKEDDEGCRLEKPQSQKEEEVGKAVVLPYEPIE